MGYNILNNNLVFGGLSFFPCVLALFQFQKHAVLDNWCLQVNVCVWLFISMCQPSDWLATYFRVYPASYLMSTGYWPQHPFATVTSETATLLQKTIKQNKNKPKDHASFNPIFELFCCISSVPFSDFFSFTACDSPSHIKLAEGWHPANSKRKKVSERKPCPMRSRSMCTKDFRWPVC